VIKNLRGLGHSPRWAAMPEEIIIIIITIIISSSSKPADGMHTSGRDEL
jgi:hypothetical protein